jgi:hypothetical protein
VIYISLSAQSLKFFWWFLLKLATFVYDVQSYVQNNNLLPWAEACLWHMKNSGAANKITKKAVNCPVVLVPNFICHFFYHIPNFVKQTDPQAADKPVNHQTLQPPIPLNALQQITTMKFSTTAILVVCAGAHSSRSVWAPNTFWPDGSHAYGSDTNGSDTNGSQCA